MKQLPWLLTAEVLALGASLLGLLFTLSTGVAAYTLVPLSLAVCLNAALRRMGDHRHRRGTLDALRRQRLELLEELAQIRQTQTSAPDSSPAPPLPDRSYEEIQRTLGELKAQNRQLNDCLLQVVKALNPVLPEPLLLGAPGVSRERSSEQVPVPQDQEPEVSLGATPEAIAHSSPSQPLMISPRPHITIPQWRRGGQFTAHEGWVNAVRLSPDGELLVTGGNDQKICFWHPENGQLCQTYESRSPISTLAFSPQGHYLASGGYDHRIQLWQHSTNPGQADQYQVHQVLEGHGGSVQTLLFSAEPSQSSRCLISGSYDQTLRLWDLETHTCVVIGEHQGSVQALVLDHHSQCLLSGGEDGQILLWSFPEGQALGTLDRTTSAVERLVLAPHGDALVAGCSDGTLRVWQLNPTKTLYVIEAHTGPVTALSITNDGQIIISGGADGRLKLWYLPSGEALGNLAEPVEAILGLEYCPHHHYLISSHPGGQVQIWLP